MLDKKVDLDKSCLTDIEEKQVMHMLFQYKYPFSLRDEIGTCPTIEIEIDVTDKSPFFIRPYHVKEEDRDFRQGNEEIMLLRNIKRSVLAYSSLGMLISRKDTKDKRLVTDFRHLNVRIAKNN